MMKAADTEAEEIAKEEVEEKVPVLKEPIRNAIALLRKVHLQLSKVAQATDAPDTCEDGVAPIPSSELLATAIPRSLQRLRIVRRTLDEALEFVEAKGEDALLMATLRQHERALTAREEADARCEAEQLHIKGVRWDLGELERSMLRSQRTHSRLGVDGSAERLGEFERQCTNVEGVHSYLTNDLSTISDSLITQLRKNEDINESMREIRQARDVAMEENAKAKQLLASGETLDVYRKSKERERMAADIDYAHAQAECNTEIRRLEEGWSATEAKYMADMTELRNEVRSMQRELDEKNRQAEQALSKQASAWSKSADDMSKQMAHGMKTLEDLRNEKTQHLHREVLRTRQVEKDLAASTQHRLAAQLNEVQLHCKNKLKMEETRLAQEVQVDRHSVEVAKKSAGLWEKRSESMREAYRGHAYKTGAYQLAMEVEHGNEPRNQWPGQWSS